MSRTDLLTPNERVLRRAPLTDVTYACGHTVPEDCGKMTPEYQSQVLAERRTRPCPRCRVANASRHNETPEVRAARAADVRRLWD